MTLKEELEKLNLEINECVFLHNNSPDSDCENCIVELCPLRYFEGE